jgi:hypothetical protein
MKAGKPYLFIGSSQECRNQKIVEVFIDTLSEEAHCIPWWLAPQFKTEGSSTTFAALCEAANAYDFAIFVLTPDDLVTSRNKKYKAPRDNVLFELGLFISAIGPERVLAFVRTGVGDVKKPSDLSGVNMPAFEFDPADEHKSIGSVAEACNGFCKTIRDAGFRKIDLRLVSKWGFNTKERRFEVTLSAARITRARSAIGSWQACIAARLQTPFTNIEDDPKIVYSRLHSFPRSVDHDVPFHIAETEFGTELKADDTIQARVLLVPESLRFDPKKTLNVAIKARCRDVESLDFTLGGRDEE